LGIMTSYFKPNGTSMGLYIALRVSLVLGKIVTVNPDFAQ